MSDHRSTILGGRPLSALTHAEFKAWHIDLLKKGVSPARQKRAINTVREILSDELISTTVEWLLRGIEPREPAHRASEPRAAWVPEDPNLLTKMWSYLPPNMRIDAKGQALVGFSPGESLGLRLGSFILDEEDDGRPYVVINQIRRRGATTIGEGTTVTGLTKRDGVRSRVVPVARKYFGEVQAYVAQYHKGYDFCDLEHPDRDKVLLCQRPRKVGDPYTAASGTSRTRAFTTAHKEYMEDLVPTELPAPDSVQALLDAAEIPDHFTPYDGRHFFTTMLFENYRDLHHLVSHYTGNSQGPQRSTDKQPGAFVHLDEFAGSAKGLGLTPVQLKHYVHVHAKKLRAVADAIDEYWEENVGSISHPTDREVVLGEEYMARSDVIEKIGQIGLQAMTDQIGPSSVELYAYGYPGRTKFYRTKDVQMFVR